MSLSVEPHPDLVPLWVTTTRCLEILSLFVCLEQGTGNAADSLCLDQSRLYKIRYGLLAWLASLAFNRRQDLLRQISVAVHSHQRWPMTDIDQKKDSWPFPWLTDGFVGLIDRMKQSVVSISSTGLTSTAMGAARDLDPDLFQKMVAVLCPGTDTTLCQRMTRIQRQLLLSAPSAEQSLRITSITRAMLEMLNILTTIPNLITTTTPQVNILMSAIERGDVDETKRLLGTPEGLKELNQKDDKGKIPLSVAIEQSNLPIVKQLIEAKADVETRDDTGSTALIQAMKKGHKDILQVVIQARPNANAVDNQGRTALIWWAKCGWPESHDLIREVRSLVNYHRADAALVDSLGASMTDYGKGPRVLVEELINNSSQYLPYFDKLGIEARARDVNHADANGTTSLMRAVKNGTQPALFERLMVKDVNLELKDGKGKTALSWAEELHNEPLAALLRSKMLLPSGATPSIKSTSLLQAIEKGDTEETKRILATPEGLQELNRKDDQGKTPLSHALLGLEHSDLAITKQLIEAKADIEVRDETGATPLIQAMKKGLTDVLQVLIEAKANPNAIDNRGRTAYIWLGICSWDMIPIMHLLVANGADPSIKDAFGTARQYASAPSKLIDALIDDNLSSIAYYERFGITLNAGDVNRKDMDGTTTVMRAVKKGISPASFKKLLVKGVKLSAKDKDGKTALNWAEELHHDALAALLRSKMVLLPSGSTPSPQHVSLLQAIAKGDTEETKRILATPEGLQELNRKDDKGKTPLSHVLLGLEHSDLAITKQLIEAKADIEVRDETGATPLIQAMKKGLTDVLEVLIEAKANPNAIDNRGRTALIWFGICSWDMHGILDLLVANGADLKTKDAFGTARQHASAPYRLIDALIDDNLSNIAYFERFGITFNAAEVNRADMYGTTAVMRAVKKGTSPSSFSKLLVKGVKLSAKDKQGKTALNWAEELHHDALAALIRSKMAKPT